MTLPADPPRYQPERVFQQHEWPIRGLRYSGCVWDSAPASQADPPPLLVLLHGWADVGASFQFLVDAMHRLEGARRRIVAPDWRGFGGTANPGVDAYWFADYLGDLDALLHALSPDAPVDLLGHSMGGNVAMSYAGARPERIRRLINLEGFGLPRTEASEAPARMARWLDELRAPVGFKPYASRTAVAARLQAQNPRLPADKAHWLAGHWAAPDAQGQWQLRFDPAHKRVNPQLYRVDEALALWAAITAPLLWVDGEQSDPGAWWQGRYSREEFDQRLQVVPQVQRQRLPGCGHMLHHDDPDGLARALQAFLDA
jgi:pimeloyl-ACP methyl ester carboxylesterase